MEPTLADKRAAINEYRFHDIHPNARFGTASDRYAGWIGQIYPERFRDTVKARPKRLAGQTFREETVPVESIRDYFEHFSVVELDFTFYRPLLEPDGKPSNNFFVLQQYAEHAPNSARFFLKAPQTFFARKLRRGSGGKVSYSDNPVFLDAEACTRQFLAPAKDLLGDKLTGVIFEQEYQKKSESPPPDENVAELDSFFSRLDQEVQSHIELRSPHLLSESYFDWLEDRGIGYVYSHWTWLPSLREQWKLSGGRFTAKDGNAIVRLLTPLRMKYEDAYALAHPFDKPVPELAESPQTRDMIADVAALIYQAMERDEMLDVIINNRVYGNAPSLGQAIAHRVLKEEERRSTGI